MNKNILKELPELVRAQVISEDTAQKIVSYYNDRPSSSANRLFIVFGILGALLIGMGIVLIIAHNWDTLPKFAKLFIGLLPLLIGQGVCGYLIIKGSESKSWREGCATFLVFGVAISISIVSQVYNIEGNLAGFLLVWMALTIPIVYVLRSSMASLLFICGITWYACEVAYFHSQDNFAKFYWLLILAILPFYYLEFFQNNKNNFFYFHSWLLVLSVTICLGVFAHSQEELIMIAYMSLFSCFVILSEFKAFTTNRVLTNAYLVVGSLGIITLLLMLSFDWYWIELGGTSLPDLVSGVELPVAAALTIAGGILLLIFIQTNNVRDINAKAFAFLLFIVIFFIGLQSPLASQLLINLVILGFAVNTIRNGARQNHLGILNYGLLIITSLILCRFFDTDFSFVVRGLLFIAVGAGFFAANFYMIQQRKK